MLKITVLHPDILAHLARAGHLATVLITDGNYPHNTRVNPRAPIVYANFLPGVISATTALEIVAELVPVEAACVMAPELTGPYAMKSDPPIWADFRRLLAERAGFTQPLVGLQKSDFNVLTRSEDLCLVIATAETQIYANLLITIGVRR